MRNNRSFINVNNNLNNDDMSKQKKYPLLSTRNVPLISHTMSTLLYEIIMLSKDFPDYCIMNIKYPQGRMSKVINIPK